MFYNENVVMLANFLYINFYLLLLFMSIFVFLWRQGWISNKLRLVIYPAQIIDSPQWKLARYLS